MRCYGQWSLCSGSTVSRGVWCFGTPCMAWTGLYTAGSVSLPFDLSLPCCLANLHNVSSLRYHSLTNNKASAIYRLRPHLPSNTPPPSTPSPPANLGIEIAPLAQLEPLLAQLNGGLTISGEAKGKGKEIAEKVDVSKVAEKVVKNVSGPRKSSRGMN
jgi:hypothetical protein